MVLQYSGLATKMATYEHIYENYNKFWATVLQQVIDVFQN